MSILSDYSKQLYNRYIGKLKYLDDTKGSLFGEKRAINLKMVIQYLKWQWCNVSEPLINECKVTSK